ncbi:MULTISPECIES: DUF2612 domain-containing protein [Citrobacter]|uniref:DUF2612 domain-containing protein n=1 Tax=Citrobacter braakii TaxID=57706 RepID=A0ABR6TQB6_CITBR|nr:MULTISPECIES: DUF2612 domain-containing protein [Citrobacter]ELK6839729.1 DUF2612 domain-containing protein [Citrobacter braakii]MBC2608556.1 DUF2612 domain-containing protein [Citrobacter braakii]MBC2632597.1 DUF2612 domain-containing protein [Citrobacter braakii]MBC2645313.1 DUF2612 domain-containing protein [Citrobacter braakii]MDM3431589.1 DUF2612 domain-containing protein [Citrobacter sp. Cb023]
MTGAFSSHFQSRSAARRIAFINETFGLDIWGKIVGIGRYITAPIDSDSFGFSEADNGASEYPLPFNDSPFYAGVQETTSVRLADDAYRTLILCKAFSNISIATIPDINKFLRMLFAGRGRTYCVNYRDMTIGITFEFDLAPYEESILTNYDVVSVPSGVQLNISQIVPPYFGFAADAYPFNDGTFYRE